MSSALRRTASAHLYLDRYWGPNENFVHIVRALLGGFQPHGVDEIIEGLKDGGVSAVEGGDFCRGNTLVSSKGLQDAGSERSIKFVVELQEHQADLIAVWEQPVAAGMGDLFDQTLGAQLPEVITEGSEFVLFRCRPECLQG